MTDDPKFNQWWDEHGQFVRSGGGQYEISFAFGAWNAARERAIEECAEICNVLSLQHTPTHENYAADACIECGDAIRALKSQQDAAVESKPAEQSEQDAWISVDERLPDSAAYVIAANKYCVGLSQYWNSAWQHIHGVTHWQPLPAPPADAAIESQRSGDGS